MYTSFLGDEWSRDLQEKKGGEMVKGSGANRNINVFNK
jgi:hypothetical protein